MLGILSNDVSTAGTLGGQETVPLHTFLIRGAPAEVLLAVLEAHPSSIDTGPWPPSRETVFPLQCTTRTCRSAKLAAKTLGKRLWDYVDSFIVPLSFPPYLFDTDRRIQQAHCHGSSHCDRSWLHLREGVHRAMGPTLGRRSPPPPMVTTASPYWRS